MTVLGRKQSHTMMKNNQIGAVTWYDCVKEKNNHTPKAEKQ